MKFRRTQITSWMLVFAIISLVLACSSRPSVLLIARECASEFNILQELKPMVAAMDKAGYRVDVVTESGKTFKVGDTKLAPDLSIQNVDLRHYSGVIIPCLACGDNPNEHPQAVVALVRASIEARLPIAAQDSGIYLMVLAGNLGPKKIAKSFQFAPEPPGVVVDGNLVTSGTCPTVAKVDNMKDGTEELMADFIKLLPAQK